MTVLIGTIEIHRFDIATDNVVHYKFFPTFYDISS